jgi:monovalent cation:H+ antiporter, CPA1 family
VVSFNEIIILLVVALAISIVSYRFKFPYSIGLVVFGVIVGTTTGLLPSLQGLTGPTAIFSDQVFFGILLPPIIYEAAIHIDYRLLRRRVWLILALALLGVVVSTLLTGFLVSIFTAIPIALALLVGSILSPTDPIAVVDLFRRERVPEQLSTIVESESLLNDGTGVVIFTAVLSIVARGDFSPLSTIGEFALLTLGGLVVGLAFAAVAYALHRRIDDPNIETALSVVLAYGSFYVATALGASGIISVAVAGLATARWIVPRAMTRPVQRTLFSFWGVIVFIANSIIFLSLGLIVNLFAILQNLSIILMVLGFVTLARACFVYVHYPLSKTAGGSRLPFVWYDTLTLSGVRGAIPVVLALTLATSAATAIPGTMLGRIITVVTGVVLFSVTVQSAMAGWYVKRRFGRGQQRQHERRR